MATQTPVMVAVGKLVSRASSQGAPFLLPGNLSHHFCKLSRPFLPLNTSVSWSHSSLSPQSRTIHFPFDSLNSPPRGWRDYGTELACSNHPCSIPGNTRGLLSTSRAMSKPRAVLIKFSSTNTRICALLPHHLLRPDVFSAIFSETHELKIAPAGHRVSRQLSTSLAAFSGVCLTLMTVVSSGNCLFLSLSSEALTVGKVLP